MSVTAYPSITAADYAQTLAISCKSASLENNEQLRQYIYTLLNFCVLVYLHYQVTFILGGIHNDKH
jgi:hypothetical protein